MITAGPTHFFSVIMNVTDQLSLSGQKTFWYSRESCKFHQSCPHDPFNLKSFILCCVKRDNQSPSVRDKEKNKLLHEKPLKISVNMEISVAKRKARGTYKTLKTLQIPQTKWSFHFHHRFCILEKNTSGRKGQIMEQSYFKSVNISFSQSSGSLKNVQIEVIR